MILFVCYMKKATLRNVGTYFIELIQVVNKQNAGGHYLGGDSPGDDCLGADVLGGDCPGGDCLGGDCTWGRLSGGHCPGGDCLGGDCPITISVIAKQFFEVFISTESSSHELYKDIISIQIGKTYGKLSKKSDWNIV